MNHPGKNIKKWRESRGWSEGQLAKKAKVPQPTIHRIETGESKDPRRSNLLAIAKVFGCDIDDLYETDAAPSGEAELDERAEKFAQIMVDLTDDQIDIILKMALEFQKTD